jgi:hypothetical protein
MFLNMKKCLKSFEFTTILMVIDAIEDDLYVGSNAFQ